MKMVGTCTALGYLRSFLAVLGIKGLIQILNGHACYKQMPPSLWFSNLALRGQTVHWIGAQFCVCIFLDSRNKPSNMFQNVSGFHLQNFRDICNVIFVGILNLLRISQRAAIAGCSEFRKRSGFQKSKRIQQIYADSAYNLRILLTVADSGQLKSTEHIFYCLLMYSIN